MYALLAWAGGLAFLLGVAGLIRPLPSLRLPDRKRGGMVAAAGFIVLLVAAGLAPSPEQGRAPAAGGAAQAGEAAAEPAIPPEQAAFIRAVVAAREDYRQAPNELAKGGVRAQRGQKICQALASAEVSGWMGRVVKLGSNSDGKGVLAVEVADEVFVATWNNALSDLAHDTLIAPGSRMFAGLAAMEEGQRVRFSGRFFSDETDCVAQQSLTLSGSMREPEFVFRFSAVSPLSGERLHPRRGGRSSRRTRRRCLPRRARSKATMHWR
jgi:hypothetical protein